jgi:DNA (cytosine-5)-methyltransferase 1
MPEVQLSVERRTVKPPYRVPSMAEIAALPWNGLKVASTFSGCGGSCTGYRLAGYRVVWANEFVPAAQATYKANAAADCILDTRDIRTVKAEEILAATGLKAGELDLFDGSPPCASFSTAGKREKGWGKVKDYSDTKQRTDDLFEEYVRILNGLQPKVFVAENVSGLVKGTAKGMFLQILAALKGCGYRVTCRVLDAQWLGVPQQRQRTIFVGVRNDLNLEPVHPLPLPYRYSVRDALPWIGKAIHDTGGQSPERYAANVDITDRPSPAITIGVNSLNSCHFKVEAETDISRYAIGAEWDKLKPGEQSEKYFSLQRCSETEPSPCGQASHGNLSTAVITHPTEKRKFTIAELRRICAFPDDFILTGTYAQQWERLGRSVPPVMMSAVAATIRDEILRK